MRITQEIVVQKILDYLNGQIALLDLVHWAEDALFALTESDEDIPNEVALMHILGYIGAGDSAGFPLTWDLLTGYLEQLGTRVSIQAEPA